MPVQSGNYKSCDPNLLKIAAKCLTAPPRSKTERRAIDLVTRIYDLATDGTDYTGAGGLTQLLKDAACFMSLTEDDLCAIATYLDWQNAINENASTPATLKALHAKSACFVALPELTQKQLMLFLKCKLNAIDEPE